MPDPTPAAPDPNSPIESSEAPITMWYVDCPFRKGGSPVVGTMGTSVRRVIMFEYDEWLRFAKQHPTIEMQQFRVGTYE